MDNYASLETASSMPPMNNTNNGHSHSYVDTEVSTYKISFLWTYPDCFRMRKEKLIADNDNLPLQMVIHAASFQIVQ